MSDVDLGDFGVTIGPSADDERRRAAQEQRDAAAREATAAALRSMQMPTAPAMEDAPHPTSAEVMSQVAASPSPGPAAPPQTPPDATAAPMPPRGPVVAPGAFPAVAGVPVDPRIVADARQAPMRQRGASAPPVAPPSDQPPPAATASVQRLDETGLPSEADIRGARDSDAVRRVFHAIGGGLRAAAGGAPSAFRSGERELQQRRDAGLQQRRGEQREDAARADVQAERAEARAEQGALRREQMSLHQQQLDQQAQRLDMQGMTAEEHRRAARAELEQRARERTQRADASSPISASYQDTMRTRIATYRATGQRALAESLERLFPEGRLPTMSAEALTPILERTGGLPQTHLRGRSGGGGGSGAATPRRVWGTDDDPLVQAAVEAGTDVRAARESASTPQGRRTLAASLNRADVSQERVDELQEETTRLPGYVRREGARRLSRQESTDALRISQADREFNAMIANLERDLARLTLAERAAGGLRQGSESYQRIQHSLDVMRTQFRQINNMGNSLGSQELVEHQFPDLSQGVSAAAILANARAARDVKHAYVTAVLDTLGYAPDGGRGGHGGGGHGGGAPAASSGAQFRVTSPDGRTVVRDEAWASRFRGRPGFRVEEVH